MAIATSLRASTALSTGLLALAVATADMARAQSVLPSGGQVVSGSAAIGPVSGNNLTITQSSSRAIVNWNSFSVGQTNSVTFQQPGSSSAILNRVTGAAPSSIAGTVSANGQVFLVNPNGIAITSTGNVRAGGGFIASTLDIRDEDFNAGSLSFSGNGASRGVTNDGSISVGDGGFVALLGGHVGNAGTISAPLGSVGLGSGEQATIDPRGDGFLQVALPTGATDASGKPLVDVSGNVRAAGGRIELKAATVRQAVRDAVNVSGTLSARTVGTRGGVIVLGGGEGGRVKVSGRVAATSRRQSGKGGAITVTGRDVKLTGTAQVDASGQTGGGTIRIGGGPRGSGPLQRAQSLTVDAGATIHADATVQGKGGDIALWSDGLTSVHGTFSAKGGVNGGDGGIIETSGKQINFTGIKVDAGATGGAAGTWLIDPTDLTIDAAAASTISTTLATTNVTLETFADGTTSGPGVTSPGLGDIIIGAPIGWSSPTTLTLNAYHGITVNAPITVSGGGTLAMNMASDPTYGYRLLSFGSGGRVDFTGGAGAGAALVVNAIPFTLIYDLAGLQGINSGLNGNYALASSLDAAGVTNWTPLGTDGTGTVLNGGNGFNGSFDGLGHTISNLSIDLTGIGSVGFFGLASANSAISNFGLIGGTIAGGRATGTLAGQAYGTVTGTFATSAVSGTSKVGGLIGYSEAVVDRAYASGTVTGVRDGINNGEIGGLIGANFGSLSNVHATGNVTSDTDYAGGLIGQNYGSVTNAYATGDVVATKALSAGYSSTGGLIGYNQYAALTNVHATGNVTATGDFVGGLIGYDYFGTTINAYSTGNVSAPRYAGGLIGVLDGGSVTRAYATGAVTGNSNLGGLIGAIEYSTGANVSNTYATGRITGSGSNRGGLVGYLRTGNTVSTSYWDRTTTNMTRAIGNLSSYAGVGQLIQTSSASNYAFKQSAYGNFNFSTNWFMIDGQTRPFLRSEYSTTITNLHQLQLVQMDLNADYKLAADIDATRASGAIAAGMWRSAGFVPIGTDGAGLILNGGNGFNGTFDGQGHMIANLKISRVSAQSTGLFGFAGSASMIRSVTLSGNGSVRGDRNTGALVGHLLGSVSNASSTIAVSSSDYHVGGLIGESSGSVVNSSAHGSVSGDGDVGGLVGENNGLVVSSFATGTVTASSGAAGGLVGDNNADIHSSYATGNISGRTEAGGLAGVNNGTIDTSYATGNVVGPSLNVGGLVGFNTGQIANASAHGSVQGNGETGGLVGENDGLIMSSFATGNVTASGAESGGLVGDNDGTITSSYATGNVSGTGAVGGLAGANSGAVNIAYATGDVVGTSQVGGLVGWNRAQISNGYATGAVRGTVEIGGLVGENDGSVNSTYATGTVTASGLEAGGLVGDNDGTISSSYATGNVFGTGDVGGLVGNSSGAINIAYATGNVTGTSADIGGLVGYNNGQVADAYATGGVAGPGSNMGGFVGVNLGTISESYATGAVTGASASTGGFAGANTGSITNSYFDIGRTGQTISAGGVGRTTAQMQGSSGFQMTFAGFDFANIWAPSGNGYDPQLYALTPVVWAQSPNVTRLYGDADPVVSATLIGGPGSYVFGPSGDVLAAQEARLPVNTSANVGTYQLFAPNVLSSLGVSYRVIANDTLTVVKRPVTIAVNPAVKIAGAPDPFTGYRVTAGTLAPGDDLANSLTRSPGETPGQYAFGVRRMDNYDITVSGELTILPPPDKASLQVTTGDGLSPAIQKLAPMECRSLQVLGALAHNRANGVEASNSSGCNNSD